MKRIQCIRQHAQSHTLLSLAPLASFTRVRLIPRNLVNLFAYSQRAVLAGGALVTPGAYFSRRETHRAGH